MKEKWTSITGYQGYFISSLGRVKNKRGKLLKPWERRGYLVTEIRKNKCRVRLSIHRAVAQEFLNAQKGKYIIVNHLNKNRHDNRIENLEWCTFAQNLSHSHWIDSFLHKIDEYKKSFPEKPTVSQEDCLEGLKSFILNE